jgi:hypothetical protein
VQVYVESGDASLTAFADRKIALDRRLIPNVVIDSRTVVIPAGTVIRQAYAGQIGNWPKFAEVDYLVSLPDGRSMTVAIAGSADPAIVDAFAAQVMEALLPTR